MGIIYIYYYILWENINQENDRVCIHNVYGVHIIDTSISEYMVIYVGMYICVCDSNVV